LAGGVKKVDSAKPGELSFIERKLSFWYQIFGWKRRARINYEAFDRAFSQLCRS